eukprot:CAMPEP_0184490354 /NCGR_PEP_ID=MMETSP0113_2-20130426/17703_1 /TAXON_ID=91329 /ORGANISM="Norrisiella sphaerica, Strain BC52" /LENGTH=149 /DNA_ID=CAMNT_0026874209 /DNA_START=106 /DNA_END=555 /DNA_ORIENTATION=-
MVNKGIYRSGFPNKRNFEFLRTLQLRSVVKVCREDSEEFNSFCEKEGILQVDLGMDGNKEPFVSVDQKSLHAAIAHIMDKKNHPVLLHCSKGKHRTGCVVACLRKIQHRSLTYIFDEYERFTGRGKAELLDLQAIELYEHTFTPSNVAK